MSVADIRKAIKDKKIFYGSDITIKMIKTGKVTEVYVASNCLERIKKDLRHYCGIANIKLNEIEESNEELGNICKKPFSVSVLCY
ncbi:MAG TPA: ribosomal L7Ae/L30e/S12e/Gadd45 family protein [Candidatus Nanoarchaeia archaeon]|nr:ribosomal L7Ae/L30e/S12e/Gadd45 family protein [Candidatus Nanoarchaeia archaeon]HLC74211.1 ribosomal L7Ae/L30e/S12e/Gadd45 family protein [Candidatus Nanoarchaeia archaeon]